MSVKRFTFLYEPLVPKNKCPIVYFYTYTHTLDHVPSLYKLGTSTVLRGKDINLMQRRQVLLCTEQEKGKFDKRETGRKGGRNKQIKIFIDSVYTK